VTSDQTAAAFSTLESFAAGTDTLDSHYENFYHSFFDNGDDWSMSGDEEEFFSYVAERMDFTADRVDRASRRDGRRSTSEFRPWLGRELRQFRAQLSTQL
jgi:hypothetical protein